VYGKLEKMKEVDVVYFKVISSHFPEVTKESHEKPLRIVNARSQDSNQVSPVYKSDALPMCLLAQWQHVPC
jgi:hypothetical protein